ncbi:ADP-ribosylglycohydrolase family protein [Sanguibacter suaedae]|uniref:ADP-ribosylglycohydrolase family protein n=1 Tax=Sanguibacter suaedae TaxID=2795737 RepID=A0A934I3D3_9MICO|nr:ADP-ribosylglycohydrolase family protein [Sanguibacter suaedae]MBI9113491.1 ADP-ribosylglycohydrolase family protein [Sanguibacter suaedae]
MRPDPLDPGVLDRASGVLLTQACGDALGVPYEFAWPPEGDAEMRGGGLGPYAPGEWSDDTQMAVCVARVAELGEGLTDEDRLDEVAAAFEEWFTGGASDVGTQTAAILRDAARRDGRPAARLRAASAALHAASGRTAGNGALMRTGAVGLVALDDRDETARAARAVAELTHADPLAGESCVLWSEAVRVAVTEERLDVRAGLDLLPADRRPAWEAWITDAEQDRPTADLRTNGFTVTAFQAAWHAVRRSPYFCAEEFTEYDATVSHLPDALHRAVRIGGDTDTVAAIAGALLGARHGTAFIPREWQLLVHGWPGMMGLDLSRLGRVTAQRGLGAEDTGQTCPECGVHERFTGRDPGRVCRWCGVWVTDDAGHPVMLYNASFAGGLDARHTDGSPAEDVLATGLVRIAGRPYRASADRYGGTLVERVGIPEA